MSKRKKLEMPDWSQMKSLFKSFLMALVSNWFFEITRLSAGTQARPCVIVKILTFSFNIYSSEKLDMDKLCEIMKNDNQAKKCSGANQILMSYSARKRHQATSLIGFFSCRWVPNWHTIFHIGKLQTRCIICLLVRATSHWSLLF